MKLNLGCGIYYKPGYVNIDLFESSVADQNYDITRLPYSTKSVDEIYASHIIEHFDIVTLPYLLSDWFMLLKPHGKIIIETPHLRKVIQKIDSISSYDQKANIRFLFGVNLLGNSHKSGFTPSVMQKLLKNVGFVEIHTANPEKYQNTSFRIEAQKPELKKTANHLTWMSRFRAHIWRNIERSDFWPLDDGESECLEELTQKIHQMGMSFFSSEHILPMLARFCVFTPQYAKLFLEVIPKSRSELIDMNKLSTLCEQPVAQKLLAVWLKKRQMGLQKDYSEYTAFIQYWKSRFIQYFTFDQFDDENWDYWNQIDVDTGKYNYFSWNLLNREGDMIYNQGLKEFTLLGYESAYKSIELSHRYCFLHLESFWNQARLMVLLNYPIRNIIMAYHFFGELLKSKELRTQWEKEMEILRTADFSPLLHEFRNPMILKFKYT